MRHHISLPSVSLVLVLFCFGVMVWLDQQPAHTQGDPFQLFQLTYEHDGPAGSFPTGFTPFGDYIYFGLQSQLGGLWRTDGTADGTQRIKDIQLAPSTLQQVGDLLYFGARDDATGTLWQSDGTADGTVEIAKGFLVRSPFVTLGDAFYFAASDTLHGTELWRSDGTSAGTSLVIDGLPGNSGAYPQQLMVVGNRLYYIGNDPSGTYAKLWQSDGTAAGTTVVPNAPDEIRQLIAFHNALYIVTTDSFGGYQLWRYAGEADGPTVVRTIAVDGFAERPQNFVEWQEQLYFTSGHESQGTVLWRTDGTTDGTLIVKDIDPDSSTEDILNLTVVGDQLLFMMRDQNRLSTLWRSDGSAAGTELIKEIPVAEYITPGHFLTLNNALYFTVPTNNGQSVLWQSDGTNAGTDSFLTLPLYDMRVLGDRIYMSVDDVARGSELWISDGSAAGTHYVKDLDPSYDGQSYGRAARVGSRFYLTTYDYTTVGAPTVQLLVSENLAAPAVVLEELSDYSFELMPVGDTLFLSKGETPPALWIHNGGKTPSIRVREFVGNDLWLLGALNERVLFFVTHDDNVRQTLWSSNGTAAGTVQLIAELDGYVPTLSGFQGKFVLGFKNEVWLTDGTTAGTTHFALTEESGRIARFVGAASQFYFATSFPDDGQRWWRSNGTAAGTVALQQPTADFVGYPGVTVGNALYLLGRTEAAGDELWYNDGLSSTLVQLTDHADVQGPFQFQWLTPKGDELYFIMNHTTYGPELWKSDGTAGGTTLVKDIVPAELDGLYFAYPGPLYPFQDKLLFAIDDGQIGRELWQSDGTAAGTTLFKDINPGVNGSSPEYLTIRNDQLFFTASDGVHGRELWQSDGTAAGTTMITDLYPGSASANPYIYDITGDSLYFSAYNGRDGYQFFNLYTGIPLTLPPADEPTPATDTIHRLYLPLVER